VIVPRCLIFKYSVDKTKCSSLISCVAVIQIQSVNLGRCCCIFNVECSTSVRNRCWQSKCCTQI